LAQLRELTLDRFVFDLNPIRLGHLVPGVGDARLPRSMVGEQQQAFAVAVQAARRVQAGLIDVVLECPTVVLARELAQHVEGFVEHHQARGLGGWAHRRRDRAGWPP